MHFLDQLIRLLLAMISGAIVGLERERHDRPAGLRTHILVSGGSALITLVSVQLAGPNVDPTRIAAQIVTGIGFLGAGTIFRAGSTVRGLTTAAGIWVVAGIGMGIAAGGDVGYLALITAVLVAVVNRWLRVLENRLVRNYRDVLIRTDHGPEALSALFAGLSARGISVERFQLLEDSGTGGPSGVQLRLRFPTEGEREALAGWMASQPAVREMEWL